MPRSIVSTTSAWCSASRAAQLIARLGVASADGSRCCGRCDAAAFGSVNSRSSWRDATLVRPTNTSASATLNAKWNSTTCWCTSPLVCCNHTWACGSSGIAHVAPITLNSRLPIGSRRSAIGARLVSSTASKPLPRLAPSTSPSATVTGTMPETAKVATSSTMARLEYDSTVRMVPTRMSITTSVGSAASSARTAGDSVNGRVAATISCSDSRISPSPIATRPMRPTAPFSRARNDTTPPKINSGDSHDRSNENTTVISALPMSAPSITTSAADSGTSERPRNDVRIRQVAVLLWIRLVTPTPASSDCTREAMPTASTWRRFSPNTRRMPVRTICVPHTSRATAASRLSR
jgi:hypothetical protein